MGARQPARIVHVMLDRELAVPAFDDRFERTLFVFWRNDRPLGQALVARSETPRGAGQLAEIAAVATGPALGWRLFRRGFDPLERDLAWACRGGSPALAELAAVGAPLAAFARATGAPVATQPAVSVVICTRDRPEQLASCLSSIAACAPAPNEVVIVDNAPRDDRTRAVALQYPSFRYVVEPAPGLSRARNTGVRAATGAIVAFTDDDVEVHRLWIARLREGFADEAIAAVTGLVVPAALDTEAEWAFERSFGGFNRGYRRLRFDRRFFDAAVRWGLPTWDLGAGANMAVRRSALQRVGGFDERLGAGAAGCSEDSELWYRLIAAGMDCVYEPAAMVHHRHRATPEALRGQLRAYARGHVTALFVQWARHGHTGNLYRVFRILPRYLLRRLIVALLNGRAGDAGLIWQQIAGSIAGVAYYLRHRHAAGAPSMAVESR